MTGAPSREFDFTTARRYWRHAPSGAGKHDTAVMAELDDAGLETAWDDAFNRRFRAYPEEELFLRGRAEAFAAKRILSIGPGIGLHEIHYQLHGARVTCADIVDTNLDTVGRVAGIKRAVGIDFLLLDRADQRLGGPFDIAFLYGSLMTMPAARQRDLLDAVMAALAPGGHIVLMLYTWAFAAASCGWSSPDQFDPLAFARASDPSVGGEHCPWSDWHDDKKLCALLDGRMQVARRQSWNQGFFIWYELARNPVGPPCPFFDPAELFAGAVAREVGLDDFAPCDAELSRDGAVVRVQTRASNFAYALATPALSRGDLAVEANAIAVEGRLDSGGLSLGVLDEDRDAFVAAAPIHQAGAFRHLLAIGTIPARFRVIVSNHHPGEAGVSRFSLSGVRLLRRDQISAPR